MKARSGAGLEDWVSRLAVLAFHLFLVETGYGTYTATPAQAMGGGIIGMRAACTFLKRQLMVSRQPERVFEGFALLEKCGVSTAGMVVEWSHKLQFMDVWPPSLKKLMLLNSASVSVTSSIGALSDMKHWDMVLMIYAASIQLRLNQPLIPQRKIVNI